MLRSLYVDYKRARLLRQLKRDADQHIEQLWQQGLDSVVVVAGYPKSGNTWVCRLIAEALQTPSAGFLGVPDADEIAIEGQERAGKVAVLKSHHPGWVLENIISDRVKVVHVRRDPFDIAVSAAFFFFPNQTDKFDRAVDLMTKSRRVPFVGWKQTDIGSFLAGYPELPTVWYERLKTDGATELQRLLSEIGFEREIEVCERAFEAQAFENRKKTGSNRDRKFLRSGKSGEFRDYLSLEHIAQLQRSLQ
jgi:hypothetical protein